MADRARGRGLHRGRVDGSDASKEALRHARLTGGEVRALTAWDFPQFHGALGWLPRRAATRPRSKPAPRKTSTKSSSQPWARGRR